MEPKPSSAASRLSQNQREAQHQVETTQPSAQGLEFDSAETLIRHDAHQTLPPPTLEERLRSAVNAEPAPPGGPWWKRWFQRPR